MIGIYKITNKTNGKTYIGQSIDIDRRWKEHRNSYKTGKEILYRAIRKHGIENFEFEIITECEKEELNELEQKYVLLYKSYVGFKKSKGYNMTTGGDSATERTPKTKEQIEKLRSKLKGRKFTKEHLENMSKSRMGKKASDETKRKLSLIRKGKKFSKEHRENIGKSQVGAKNHQARKIICNGTVYDCMVDFCKEYGYKKSCVCSWLNKRTTMPKEFVDMDLRYFDDKTTVYKHRTKGIKKIHYNGKIYNTIIDLSNELNINKSTIGNWLRGRCKTPKEHHDLGLRYATEEDLKTVK